MSRAGCRNGIVLANKPRGWTSFDVVSWARRRLDNVKVGHAGTLDPDATGLLVLLVGQATKLSQYLMLDEKEYLARVRLGIRTDTDDATGDVVAEQAPPPLSEADIEETLTSFRGTIRQVPPAVSALKQGGRRWYRLAREGAVFERVPRDVTIHELELRSYESPFIGLRVVCSKGTYIRALARDIGETLGCGGCLVDLVRIRVGRFELREAIEAEEGTTGEELSRRLLPLEDLLPDWPKAMISDEAQVRVGHGAAISSHDLRSVSRPLVRGDRVRLFSPAGKLVSIAEAVSAHADIMEQADEGPEGLELQPLRLLIDTQECT
ncbi:hypothetical protein AMJ71_02840 [candidate division TA06 bacterium SM1_40]|jgi:tRNA pseudouridine55 synthase|uniref:tRNA pseudouridine synthase B n=1 Tax=candidate division TA06 bacterium SM1_40 TaxID=1703773 RepID=A0A0S8JPE5_UNCT6|nr:MAG: hypothetical protein AMJ71_02840 [candidate division TA06 bacterium SM1_40]